MEEDKNRPDFRYRTHIDMTEPHEVYYWSKHFNISPDHLMIAQKKAKSNKIKDIETQLSKSNEGKGETNLKI